MNTGLTVINNCAMNRDATKHILLDPGIDLNFGKKEYVTNVIARDTNDMPMHAIVRRPSEDISVSIEIVLLNILMRGNTSSIQIRIFPSFVDSYGLAEIFISGKWKSFRIFFQSTPNSLLCSVTCLQFNNGLNRTFLINVVLRGSFFTTRKQFVFLSSFVSNEGKNMECRLFETFTTF